MRLEEVIRGIAITDRRGRFDVEVTGFSSAEIELVLDEAQESAPDPDQAAENSTPPLADAVSAVHDQLGAFLDGAIPVCTAPGKVYGIDQWLMPAIAGHLDQAHAVAFLRCLKGEANTGRITKIFHQLLATSKALGGMVFAPRAP